MTVNLYFWNKYPRVIYRYLAGRGTRRDRYLAVSSVRDVKACRMILVGTEFKLSAFMLINSVAQKIN